MSKRKLSIERFEDYYTKNVLTKTKNSARKFLKKNLTNNSSENINLKTDLLEFIENFFVLAKENFIKNTAECDTIKSIEELNLSSKHQKLIDKML